MCPSSLAAARIPPQSTFVLMPVQAVPALLDVCVPDESMTHHITRLFTTGHTSGYLVRLRRLAMQRGEQYLSQVPSSHRTRTRPRPLRLMSHPVTSFRTTLLDISAPKPKPRGANIGVRPGILGVTSTVERGASSCIKRDMNVCSLRCHPVYCQISTRMINTQTQPLTVRNNL